MTANIKNHTLWPAETIHVPGFFISLVAAPLIVTLLTFWAIIPIFALVLGGPVYLALGTPSLLWLLSRRRVTAGKIAGLALLVNVAATTLVALLASAAGKDELRTLAYVFLVFGFIFAPLWGLTFGWLYNGFLKTPDDTAAAEADPTIHEAPQPERT